MIRSLVFICMLVCSTSAIAQTTYYSFQSGSLNAANIWTTDPSGSLLIGSATPGSADHIVVLNGRTITITQNNRTFASVEIKDGGTLNVASTTGHNFTTLLGQGVLRLESATLPAGTLTSFLAAGNGTVEFAGSANFAIPSGITSLNNLTISGSGTKSLNHNITVFSDFTVNGGRFVLGNTNAARTLQIDGDLIVNSGATFEIGSFNQTHTIELYGDLTNNGGDLFLNGNARDASPFAAPTNTDYTSNPNDGMANVEMLGTSDAEILANGTTAFNRLIINKGTDETFVVTARADVAGNFFLFGRNNEGNGSTSAPFSASNPEIRKALWIRNGTFRIQANIEIQSLTEGGNDFFIPENAQLFIDGGTAFSTTTANGSGNQGITVLGTFRIDGGTFETRNSAGIVFREQGTVLVYGGEVGISQLRRSSASAGNNFTSYIQTGGIVTVDGRGENNNAVGRFGINQPDAVFRMEGGILRLEDNNGAATGGFQVDSDPSNIFVSGGTIEITPDGGNFEIGSNAPIFNLVLNNGANNVELTRDLEILNDLTIAAGTDFDANNFDLEVGGDFNLAGTYTAGSNTTTLDGDENSNINISSGATLTLNNLTINKSDTYNDTLFVTDGNATLFTINGTLEHLNGVTNLDSYNIDVNGDVTINSQLGLSANTGEVQLSGTAAQTITIPTVQQYPAFSRLEINNANGVTLAGSGKVLYVLNETQLEAGIFDIGVNELVSYSGVTTTGTFSNTLMIETAGNNTDGGLTIGHYGNATLTYPLGTDTDYTPATVTVSSWSDDGLIQINPGDLELATLATVAGDALQYYWRVRHRDFTAVPNVSYSFEYPNSAISGNEANYVAGKVVGSSRSTDDPAPAGSGGGDNVDEATNTITFDNAGGGNFALETASYTAAETARFSGSVRVLYSRVRGGNRNATYNLNQVWDWDDAASWTEDSTTNVAASTPPGPGDIVIVTYGGTHNPNGGGNRHHIIIENTGGPGPHAQAAEVIVRDGPGWASRLYIRQNAVAELGTITGDGDVWYLVTETDVPDVTADYGEFAQGNGRFNYLRQGGNDITFPANPNVFPTIRMEAGAANVRFSFPGDIQVNKDLIVDNLSILRVNHNITVLERMFIGGFQEGVLEFPASTGPVIVDVYGLIRVRNDNDSDIVAENAVPSPANLSHTLIARSDLDLQQGEINLFTSGRAPINLEFRGGNAQTFSNATGNIPELNRIIVDKNVGTAATITTDFNLNAASDGADKPIDVQQGTLVLNNNNIDVVVNSGNDDWTIPQGAVMEVQAGTIRVTGDDTGILLSGEIAVTGANGEIILNDGAGGGNDNNYIEYTGSGAATIRVSAGRLEVGSQIRRGFLTSASSFTYNQTGGQVYVGYSTVPNNARATFEILNPGSSFTHTGGDLFLVREQPNASIPGLLYDPVTVNATAPIVIGSAETPASHQFFMDIGQPIGALTINDAATGLDARLQINALTVNDNLTIETGTTFNTNGLDLNIAGTFTNDGTFTGTNSTVTFNGTGAQSATINSVTTFENLVVDKSSGILTFGGSTNPTITNDLSILSGTLNDGGSNISVQGDLIVESSHASTGAGRILLNGSSAQNIQTDGSATIDNIEINNSNGIVLIQQLNIDGTLTMTDGNLNINEYLLTFGSSSSIAGSPGSSSMIRTDGSSSAGGLRRTFGTGATNFTFPMGVLNKYTPAQYNFSSNTTQGDLTVRPVNLTSNSATDGGDDLLGYYWNVSASSFTTFNVTQSYTYDQADVQVTGSNTEADYVPGRFSVGNWTALTTSEVNTSTNVFQFPNVAYLSGDYTAGVVEEFGVIQTYYSRSGATGITTAPGADWSDANTWSTLPWSNPNHNTTIPANPPNGNDVRINTGHFVFMSSPTQNSGSLELNGTLDIANTVSHNFGSVSGTGTLEIGYTNTNVPFPAGDFSAFNGPGGGTVRYAPENDLTLPALTEYNRLEIVSVGNFTRTLPAQNIIVHDNITISGGARFDPNNRTINLRGDFINSSSNGTPFVSGTSTIILDGSNQQTIGGINPTTFYRLTIDNGQTDNLINRDITVTNQLNVDSGELNLNGRVITLGTGATLSEADGERIRGLTGYIETTRNLSASPGDVAGLGFEIYFTEQALGNTVIRRYHTPRTENGLASIYRYFEVSPTTNTGLNASVRFRYQQEEIDFQDESTLVLYRKSGSNPWVQRGGTVNMSSNYVQLTGIDAFSDWTVDNPGSLPVSLVSFEGEMLRSEYGTRLEWITASEYENFGFKLFRQQIREDAVAKDNNWEELVFLEGQGTSYVEQRYEFVDKSIQEAGRYVYRLEQIDYDGQSEIFGPIEILMRPPDSFELRQNYPNPFNPITTIEFLLAKDEQVLLEVFDITGRRISTLVNDQRKAGKHTVQFNAKSVASGVYIVRMITANQLFIRKMTVLK